MPNYTVYLTTTLTAVVKVEAEDFEAANEIAYGRVPYDPLPGYMRLPNNDGVSYDVAGDWEPAGGWDEDKDRYID